MDKTLNQKMTSLLEVENLEAWQRNRQWLRQINFKLDSGNLLAIIGPLGAGKTTLLRCMNRLFELQPDSRVGGEVRIGAANIYDKDVDVLSLRRKVGLVFSEPTVFRSMSIYENVAVGLRLARVQSGAQVAESVEKALRHVHLWNDVKDQLRDIPQKLSYGDLQKLCIARALVLRPEILLMDDPTATLGLQEVTQFEQMLQELKDRVTVVFTTSHRKQAARVSDKTAFLLDGELIEIGKTSEMFMNPKQTQTEDYLTGRFG